MKRVIAWIIGIICLYLLYGLYRTYGNSITTLAVGGAVTGIGCYMINDLTKDKKESRDR